MIDVLKPLIKQFLPFAQQQMGFTRPPRLFLRQDTKNASNPLGKTGFYDPDNESITLYITGRHPKDIMRSLAHELQHHTQKCNGEFDNTENMGEQGYAQCDPHMRTMEIEAYKASIVFRDWEDSLKETIYYEHLQKGDKSSMSTKNWKNGEIKSLLAEAWGFGFNLKNLSEERTGSGIDHGGDDDKEAEEETEGRADSKREEEGLELKEDSGYEEKEHDEHNAWSDEDHIDAIEKHLRALRHDRDYEEDHESLEEGNIDERRGRGRKGPSTRTDDPRLREAIAKLQKSGLSKKQLSEVLEKAVRIYKGKRK